MGDGKGKASGKFGKPKPYISAHAADTIGEDEDVYEEEASDYEYPEDVFAAEEVQQSSGAGQEYAEEPDQEADDSELEEDEEEILDAFYQGFKAKKKQVILFSNATNSIYLLCAQSPKNIPSNQPFKVR